MLELGCKLEYMSEFNQGRLYDITDFAARMNAAAALVMENRDLESLESFDWYGNELINRLEKFPDQRYTTLEVLSSSDYGLVRAEACWALDSAYGVNPKATMTIWRRLLTDPDPRVGGAAAKAFDFATNPEPGERKTIKWRHTRALRPLARAAFTKLK